MYVVGSVNSLQEQIIHYSIVIYKSIWKKEDFIRALLSRIGGVTCPLGRPVIRVAIIIKELLPRLDVPAGENCHSVVAVHHEDLCAAVGVVGVVGKPQLVAALACVDDPFLVEVKEVAAVVAVVALGGGGVGTACMAT